MSVPSPALSVDGLTVGVLGLGKSGVAASRLLLGRGATVVAMEEQAGKPPGVLLDEPRFSLRHGALDSSALDGLDLVVVSPGVPWNRPELQAARDRGVRMMGEIELGFLTMPPGAGPILGITGTNGKSTTTALLGELVRRHRPDTFVGGNLGTPFTEAYRDPARPPYAFHVLELSSFQLEGIDRTVIDGAAILNLTPDHLDRYPDLAAYGEAKRRIFRNLPREGFAVVNGDDVRVLGLARGVQAPVYAFSQDESRTNPGWAGMATGRGQRFGFSFGPLSAFTVTSRALRGPHNLANAMAASLLAARAGVPPEAIQAGLEAFPGLPHRLEVVGVHGGVEWVNDSKATNVDSAVMALNAFDGNVWLIAGGKGKGAPYTPLVEAARGKLKGVLTIGEDAPAIEAAFAGRCPVERCGTLAAAVAWARKEASSGDVVLLSPACASYDQFDNFEHRGATFRALVEGSGR